MPFLVPFHFALLRCGWESSWQAPNRCSVLSVVELHGCSFKSGHQHPTFSAMNHLQPTQHTHTHTSICLLCLFTPTHSPTHHPTTHPHLRAHTCRHTQAHTQTHEVPEVPVYALQQHASHQEDTMLHLFSVGGCRAPAALSNPLREAAVRGCWEQPPAAAPTPMCHSFALKRNRSLTICGAMAEIGFCANCFLRPPPHLPTSYKRRVESLDPALAACRLPQGGGCDFICSPNKSTPPSATEAPVHNKRTNY